MLSEAPVNDLDDSILLLRGHLVVARQAEASAEDVRADVQAGSGDVGVALSPAVALDRDESVGAVDWLHVHGLPDGAAFGIEGGEGGENFTGAGLARFMPPELILFATDKGAHGFLVDDHAAEPEVGFTVFLVIWIHLHRKILQAFSVTLVDGLLLGDVFVQVRNLAADDTGDNVGHTVVISDLLMLVPGSVFPALGGPLAHLVGILEAVGQEHAAGGAGDDLVAVEGDAVIIPEGAGLFALVRRAEGLGRVFDDQGAVAVADLTEFIDLAGGAIEVGNHDELHIRIERKGLFQGFGAHVPGVVLGI